MSNMSEDIQYAGSDTRPPMLDRIDFESWQQRIRLYCPGKDNGENIMKSITEGPFQMGTFIQTPTEETEGIPKDIYTLINHYTDAKDIWDNVKMILEGSELIKDDRESQLYNEFEHFRQIKGETIHVYYVRFMKLINDMRNIQYDHAQNASLTLIFEQQQHELWECWSQNRGGNVNPGFRLLDKEQLLFLAVEHVTNFDDDVDYPNEKDLALNVDHIFEADQCDAFDSDVDEGPNIQTRVNTSTEASESKPRSDTKKNRILPAKRKKFTLEKLNCGYQWRPTGKKFALGELCPLTKRSCDLQSILLEDLDTICSLYRQFWDSDTVKLLFRKHSCLVRVVAYRRLNHLNFGTINDLARKDLVRGLPRLKFEKDHLCSACQLGKSKKYSHKPKSENTNMEVLHTLHMDLCGPMRVHSINGKKYILVIVDDYSRFTWVKFLRSKDETPEFVINFLKQIQVGLNKTVRYIRTDNGTEFVNQVMSKYYEGVGIFHQKSVPRTPQQNGVVERRNRTLVEATRTMLIVLKAPMFLWVEAVATACYTQNLSLIHTRHNKTPYELMHDKKLDLTFLRVFGGLCYPTNDSEDLGKLQAKADIGIFVGYAPSRKGFRIYNKRTRRIMEIIHVTFDELHQTMAPVHISSGPEPMSMTSGQFSSGVIPNQVHATNYFLPTDKDLELLFQPMFDEYFEVTRVDASVPLAIAVNAYVVPPGTSVSTTFAQDAPSTRFSLSSSGIQPPVIQRDVAVGPTIEDTPIT
ncbi:retrovirus-related pol polyprotein from transposon TNT 1-94 [Tanacetum coccineum]